MQITPIFSGGRTFLQKFANNGNLRAAIYGPTPDATVSDSLKIVFTDLTRTVSWPLSTVSNNCTEACCCLLNNRLIVSSRNNKSQTVVTEFTLVDPFSFAPSSLAQVTYGDSDSRGSELVVLKSGEVISVTYQHTDMRVCAYLRTTDGRWLNQGMFTISDEKGTSHFFSMATAPWADNELWVFDTMDGGKGCAVGIFKVVNNSLVLSESIPVLIPSRLTSGDYYWNGELVFPIASTDSKNNKILLSYTNTLWPPNTNQMAFPVLSAIGVDKTPIGVFKSAEAVVSIKNPCPIITGVPLSFRAKNPPFELVTGAVRLPTKDGQISWNQYAPEFLYTEPDTGRVVLVVLNHLPDPTPVPPPDMNVAASPMCYLSWSGADQMNTGKYMLQKASSKDGPWIDITDRWPYAFQTTAFKQVTGPLIEVNGNFFRLRVK